ncbi:MAG: glycosyltransferase [Rhodobacteraceae bacterium]|nr:glycosyltransferase [Paracoccaceae bacterium]
MANILCITNGLSGLLFASFEVARRLEETGHSVTCVAPAAVKKIVEDQGFRFEALPESLLDAFEAEDASRSLSARILTYQRRRRAALTAIQESRAVKALHSLSPDLVLVDIELPEIALAARSLSIPTALLVTWMSIWRSANVPPLHLPVRPEHSGESGVQKAWRRYLLRKRAGAWRRCATQTGFDHISQLRRFSRQVGVPLSELNLNQWLKPATFHTTPSLVLNAFSFEFPHVPPPQVTYVGPMIYEARREAEIEPVDVARLHDVMKQTQGSAKRLILGAFGAQFTARRSFVERLLASFAMRPDWEMVLALGQYDGPSPPSNVHIFKWLPQLQVLAEADLAIIHGGINTINECIRFCVPMLAFSGGMTDMDGNIARLLHHGIGAAGNPISDTPEELVERIEAILQDAEVRQNVNQMHQAIERERNAGTLEQQVERLLARS